VDVGHCTVNTFIINSPFFNFLSPHCPNPIRVFDVYVNILKYMYSTRFNGGSTRS
jgi:hypothetical protein